MFDSLRGVKHGSSNAPSQEYEVQACTDPGVSDRVLCQAGSCRRAGARGTLLEIEERAAGLTECLELLVEGSGCQGNCGQAPSALVIFNPDQEEGGKEEKKFSHVSTLESSQLVVEFAVGLKVQTPSPKQSLRLQIAGAARTLEAAKEACKWNQALGCIVQMEAFKQSSMNHQEDTHQLYSCSCKIIVYS